MKTLERDYSQKKNSGSMMAMDLPSKYSLHAMNWYSMSPTLSSIKKEEVMRISQAEISQWQVPITLLKKNI